ncbi:ABC transporter substrate-binding protein [Salinarimonas soli]|uniref:ABC transporter substrate-binding protein n=1 Tax=Salinarimonas soli TaxID=1638099 RepID=A0A5B2VFH0_9HYPH|nr:ABC transporter substrate-binding protein [Salinarimonas soli]
MLVIGGLAAAMMAGVSAPAAAQGTLNLYCSVQVEWCQAVATNFQRDTGIRVNMTQKGSGETLAQIRAEAQNPKGDVWFGGTGDPHLIVAEEGLSEAYQSPRNKELQDWALKQYEAAKGRSVGVYSGAVGFGYNKELLGKKKIAAPACWADLVKPEYKGEIQVANPNSSGTAYVIIATLVQLMGEEKAFDYLKSLNANVNAYARSGTGPIKAVARGETGVSLSFMQDAATEVTAGFPVGYNAPCEGTGYEIGSVSIIKGGRNTDNAKKFVDWALSPEAQKIGYEVAKQYHMPSNKSAPLPPGGPDLTKMKLVNYDFNKYGQASERKRLLERWDREIGSLPR